MKKRISMMLAVVCMVLSMSTVSKAAVNEEAVTRTNAFGDGGIQPYYENTANISASFKIEGNTAYCYSEVAAKRVCFINMVLRLQRKEGSSWHTVSSWVGASTSGSKVMSKSFTLSTRGTYRVYSICTVDGEEVTCASVSKTY